MLMPMKSRSDDNATEKAVADAAMDEEVEAAKVDPLTETVSFEVIDIIVVHIIWGIFLSSTSKLSW